MTELDSRTRATLDRLVPPASSALAWDDVLVRAGVRVRRRARSALVAGLAVAAIAVATPALGGPDHVVRLLGLKGPPAPRLPRAADTARQRALAIVAPDGHAFVIVAAPWRGHDGVCWLFRGLGNGCSIRSRHGLLIGLPRGPGRRSSLNGVVFDRRAKTVELQYASGDVARDRVLWIGSPIDAGFFAARVPTPSRPVHVVLRDRAGSVLSRTRLAMERASGSRRRERRRLAAPPQAVRLCLAAVCAPLPDRSNPPGGGRSR